MLRPDWSQGFHQGSPWPARHGGELHPWRDPVDTQAAAEGKHKNPTLVHARQGLVPDPSPKTWQPWLTHICWDIFVSRTASKS